MSINSAFDDREADTPVSDMEDKLRWSWDSLLDSDGAPYNDIRQTLYFPTCLGYNDEQPAEDRLTGEFRDVQVVVTNC
jgi:hypothetical protein